MKPTTLEKVLTNMMFSAFRVVALLDGHNGPGN